MQPARSVKEVAQDYALASINGYHDVMLLGYNTNGFAHHRLEDVLPILAEIGYRGVALTIDHHALNPFDPETLPAQVNLVKSLLTSLSLRCVVETGARFLLDPRHKHQPTLLSADAEGGQRRLDFLQQAISIAAELGADGVSFWSGAARTQDAASSEVLFSRLTAGCLHLCDYAADRGVRLAFEPEPGMFIDTMHAYGELARRVNHPAFGLTLDLGHLHCQGETPIADAIHQWKDRLWNVHIEDMRRGVHYHLLFGEGEMDFPPILAALEKIGYVGGIYVELSRHSHDAVATARKAFDFLQAASFSHSLSGSANFLKKPF